MRKARKKRLTRFERLTLVLNKVSEKANDRDGAEFLLLAESSAAPDGTLAVVKELSRTERR